MATDGQFYWPSVGTFVAAYGQFFMAANRSQVKIEPTGPNSFRLTIPQFIGIGFDKPTFEDPLVSNSALGWLATPAAETRMVNNILSDENKQKYISQNEAALKEQAKVFYSGLISNVDPEVSIDFEFVG